MGEKGRALIAMSGGVDSSVAAFLMKERGFACMGVTMRLFCAGETDQSQEAACGAQRDVDDARRIAAQLGMPFAAVDFSGRFREAVVDRFALAYEQGRTPNPCIDCNRYLKFAKMYDVAQAQGYDYVVTGHYARVERGENGRWLLKKGLDAGKDQSYVLYSLSQEQLSHTILPLGSYRKPEIRAIAEAQGFLNAGKKDSQDICFVPDGDYAAFITAYTGKSYPAGDFVDPQGNVLGRHRGIIHYTVGQRRGLGVSGGKALYVKEIRPGDNTVVLAEDRALYQKTALVSDFNWISMEAPAGPIQASARVRYHQKEQPARAEALPDGRVRVDFLEPQRAITKGQALVLYDGETVVGGGTIEGTLDECSDFV